MSSPAFTYTHTIETDVPAEAIWSLYEDVTTWPSWDAGAERITRDGPFQTGTTGTMKLDGQEPLHYRLAKVEPLREFVDETPGGALGFRVSPRPEPQDESRLRVTYAVQIEGPTVQAQEIGPMITAD